MEFVPHMGNLFSKIRIGEVELSNRIVMPAIHLGYADEAGHINEKIRQFYFERAKGGVGLIIIGNCYVHKLGKISQNAIGIDNDNCIKGLKQLTDFIHQNETKVGIQLAHGGGECSSKIILGQPIAASCYKGTLSKEISRELTVDEIKNIQEQFIKAAIRARKAGFDLIELHCFEDFLLHEFLSPHINTRNDDYGGSLKNRMRFVIELIEMTKEALGKNFPVTCRISANELAPGKGRNSLDDWKRICKEMESVGVDGISVTQGCNESRVPQIHMSTPRGAFIYITREIKSEVSVPVCASTRINSPILAESIIREGWADLIALGRPLIADPDLAKKAKEGKIEDIIPCIACNQGCFDNTFKGKPVGCLVNPRAGNEYLREIRRTRKQKKIMIIGAGPAGIEACYIASQRGHKVSLFEKSNSLGGKYRLASFIPGKYEIGKYLEFMSRQLAKMKVKINLNIEADEKAVKNEQPDTLIIATGGKVQLPDIPGIDKKHVHSALEVIAGMVNVGKKIVIIGGGGVGCDTALYLSRFGTIGPDVAVFLSDHGIISDKEMWHMLCRGNMDISMVEYLPRMGNDIGRTSRWIILNHLRKYNVKMYTNTEVLEVLDDKIRIRKEGIEEYLEADSLIYATGNTKESYSFDRLDNLVQEFYKIGDCRKPGDALKAIQEGFEIGMRV